MSEYEVGKFTSREQLKKETQILEGAAMMKNRLK